MWKNRLVAGAVIATVLAAAAVLAATAAAKPSKQASQESTVKLGFITKFPVDFYFTLVNAAKKWDKATPGATVIYASGKSGTDDAGEIAAIQNMIAQGVKGIAITPTSPAVSSALDKAIKQGIKVVLIDNDIPAWKKKSSVVATNNYNGGVLAGKYLATKLKAGDTLGILEGNPANPGARAASHRRPRRPGCAQEPDQGGLEARDRLRPDEGRDRSPDDTDRESEPDGDLLRLRAPALGAIQSIKNAGIKPSDIILVGFDASPDEIKAIKAGTETASVAQFPAKMGSLGIATLYGAVMGKSVPKNVDTGTALVTKVNAAKFG